MASPNSASFSPGLLVDKQALFYTALAATTAAVLLLVAFSRQATTTTPGEEKSTPRSGKMPPQVASIKVTKILVHPIKSCRGTSVQSARYTPQGLENDRCWSIIDAESGKIVTAREVSKLVLISPRIKEDRSSPEGGSLVVTLPEDSGCESFAVPLRPSDKTLSGWSMLKNIIIWPGYEPLDGYICQQSGEGAISPSDTLSKYIGRPVHLVYKGPMARAIDPTYNFPELKATAHYQDMYPLLLLSEENVQAIEEQIRPRVGTQGIERRWEDDKVKIERFSEISYHVQAKWLKADADKLRFRPNIVFRGGGAFGEDDWEEISIGSEGAPSITLVSKCTRCLLPNVDPETGLKDVAVPYKVIMKFRSGLDPVEKMKPCIGCNAVPGGDGVVKVGDDVHVKKMW